MRIGLMLAVCCLVGCATPKPPFFYEIDFEVDGRPVQALRPARCFSEIICPKRARDDRSPVPPRPWLAVSPVAMGRHQAEAELRPKRPEGARQLVVLVRLSSGDQARLRWSAKWRRLRGWPQVGVAGQVAMADHQLVTPPFPIEVGVVPAAAAEGMSHTVAGEYFRVRNELAQARKQPGFDYDTLPAHIKRYYEQGPPPQMRLRELSPGDELRFEVPLPEGPLHLSIHSPHLDIAFHPW